MNLCIYANCQGDGIAHFLRKAAPEIVVKVHHNWQILMGETSADDLMRDAAACDVFLYQPTAALKHGMLSTEEMVAGTVKATAEKLSFPYVFNTGFFPIVKHGCFWTGAEVIEEAKRGNALARFDRGEMNYDCRQRFEENLTEQREREAGCDLQFAGWILEHHQDQHLFLLCNHPASDMLMQMTRKFLSVVFPGRDFSLSATHPNEAGLPGYHAVHPAVKRELGLRFEPDRNGEDAEFYRVLMAELDSVLKGTA